MQPKFSFVIHCLRCKIHLIYKSHNYYEAVAIFGITTYRNVKFHSSPSVLSIEQDYWILLNLPLSQNTVKEQIHLNETSQ